MSWLDYPEAILPGWLITVLNFGAVYPDGDQDALFALGDAWKDVAGQLEALIPELERVGRETQDCYVGDGATAVGKQFDQLYDDGEYSVQKLVAAMEGLGHDTRAAATQIEYIKIQSLGFAVLTLYMVNSLRLAGGYGLATIPVVLAAARRSLAIFARAGAKELAALASRNATTVASKTLVKDLIAPLAEQLATKEAAKLAAQSALKAGLLGAGIDAGVQGIQLWEGHRDDGFDVGQMVKTGAAWGAGGLLGAPLHAGLSKVFAANGMNPLRAGFLSGGLGGVGAGVGMYAGGIGTQAYDRVFGNHKPIDWTFHPQLLTAGFGLGAMGGLKAGFKAQNLAGSGAGRPGAAGVHGSGGEGGPRGGGSAGAAGPFKSEPWVGANKEQTFTPESEAAGKSLYRALAKEVHPDKLVGRSVEVQELGEGIFKEAGTISEASENRNFQTGSQNGYSEQMVARLAELRAHWHEVAPLDGSSTQHGSGTGSGGGSTTRAGVPTASGAGQPGSAVPQRNPVPDPQLAGDAGRSTGRTPDSATGQGSNIDAARGKQPVPPRSEGTEPMPGEGELGSAPDARVEESGEGTLTGDQPRSRPQETGETSSAAPGEPTAVEPASPEPAAVEPVSKEIAVAEREAADITPVTPRDHESGAPAPTYEAHRYRDDSGQMRTELVVRVEILDAEHLSPTEFQHLADRLRAQVEQSLNTGQRLLNGDPVAVVLGETRQPGAHAVPARSIDPATFLAQVREHLGLPAEPGTSGFTPEDLRRISNDIAAANTQSPFGGLYTRLESTPEVIGDGKLAQLELTEFQHWVEDAARNDTGFVVGFDPATHPVADVINDGGNTVPGRNTNCAVTSLAALFTFHGRPTVALAMAVEMLPDGTFDYGRGLTHDRVADVLRADFMEFDQSLSIPEQYRQLQDLIESLGPGASAFVATKWQLLDADTGERVFRPDGSPVLRRGHATVIVHPHEAASTLPPELAELFPPEPSRPTWWDPQSGEVSVDLPEQFRIRAGQLRAIVLLPDGTPLHARTSDASTGTGLSGTGTGAPSGVPAVPVRVRLGDLTGADPAGTGPGRLGDAVDPGAGLADRADLATAELAGRAGNGGVPEGGRAGGDGAGPSNLSAPNPSAPPPDPGRAGAGGVRGGDRIAGEPETARAGLPADDRQADVARASDGHVVGDGDGVGSREPDRPELAGDRDVRVLEGDRAAPDITPVRARNGEPDSPAPTYEARRYRDDSGNMRTALLVRMEIVDGHSLPPARFDAVADKVRAAVDQAFNTGARLLNGDPVTVELAFVDPPEGARVAGSARVGDPLAAQAAVADRFLAQVREQLGLPAETVERGFTPDNIRQLSDDIAAANTASPFDNHLYVALESTPATKDDGRIKPLEAIDFQRQVENAVRTGNGFAAGFDPRVHPVADLINDGGAQVPGRDMNCVITSLAALYTFHGRPAVAFAMAGDMMHDGTLVYQKGLQPERVEAILRADFQAFDQSLSIPEQARQLRDLVESLGPGASALVAVKWQDRDPYTGTPVFDPVDNSPVLDGSGHATTIVYPREIPEGLSPAELAELYPLGRTEPVWWDAQERTAGLDFDYGTRIVGELKAIVLLPDGKPLHARTAHPAAGPGLPGAHQRDSPAVHPAPLRVRLGDLTGLQGPEGLPGAAETGAGLGHGEGMAAAELVGVDGDGRLPQGTAAGDTAAGQADLSAPGSRAPEPGSGRAGPGGISGESRGSGESGAARAGLPTLDRQEDIVRTAERPVVGDGPGLGAGEQNRPELAGDRDVHLLEDLDSGLTGPPVSPWDPLRAEQQHTPTTTAVAQRLQSAVGHITTAKNTQHAATTELAKIARSFGVTPEGLAPRALEQALRAAFDARAAQLDEIITRGGIAPEEMVAYFEERREANRQSIDLLRTRRAAYRALDNLYKATEAEHLARETAETSAVRDVIAATGAQQLQPGVALLPGDPPVLLAVSRTVVRDHLVGPDLRREFADEGIAVRYLQVRVDGSGAVMVVEVRGPAMAAPPAPDPAVAPAPDPVGAAAPDPAAGAVPDPAAVAVPDPATPAAPDPTSVPAPTAVPAPHPTGGALLDRLQSERQQLIDQRESLRGRRDELARTLEIDPAVLERKPGESEKDWKTRIADLHELLRNRPWQAKGVRVFEEPVPLEEYPRYRRTVDEYEHAFDEHQQAVAAVERISSRVETAQWLESERSSVLARRETVQHSRNQLAESLGVAVAEVEPARAQATLERLRAPEAPIENTEHERVVEDLAQQITEIDRLTRDIDSIDADLAAVADDRAPTAYHAQLVRDRDALVSDREFWRGKRDSRAARLDVRDPDHALAPGNLAETIANLRERVIGTRTTAAIGDDPATTVPEPVTAAEAARRHTAVDNLQDAAERFNELSSELSLVEQRLPAEVSQEAVISDQSRAEIDRLGRERSQLWQDNTSWRKMRGDLATRLGVDLARLGPGQLAETIAELRARPMPAEQRAEYLRQLDFLAEASERTNQVENQTGRMLDRMAELAGAGKEIMRAAGARPVTDRVGVVTGENPRVIVVGPREELGRPRADHDSALAHAIEKDARLARAVSQPQTVIEYAAVIGNIEGPWHVEQLPAPARVIPTPAFSVRGDFDIAMWRDGQGVWHPIDTGKPGWKYSDGPEFKIARFYPKDPPDGMSTHAINTLHATMMDPFIPGPVGHINKAFLEPVPMGGRMNENLVPTFADPYAGAAGALIRMGVELPKLTGFRLWDSKDPYTFHPHIKKPAWYEMWVADSPVERQPMVREWEAWDHDRSRQETVPSPQQQQAIEQWARVQEWADAQYARFRTDDSDLAKISDNLAAKSEIIRHAQAGKLIEDARKLAQEDPNTDYGKISKQLAGHLRDEQPGDAKALLKPIIAGYRTAVTAKLADPVFTPDQLLQIKNHLMRDELLISDPTTGDPVRRPLDALGDVAEAWQRLIDGTPLPADILLLRDALSESNYLRLNPTERWTVANQHAIARGFDWDSNRPPPAKWRAKIDYAPAPLQQPHSPLPSRAGPTEAGPPPHATQEAPDRTGQGRSEPATSELGPNPAPGQSPESDPAVLQQNSRPESGNVMPQQGSGSRARLERAEPGGAPARRTAVERHDGAGTDTPPGSRARPEPERDPHRRTPWLYGVGPWDKDPQPPTGPVAPPGPNASPPPIAGDTPPATPQPGDAPPRNPDDRDSGPGDRPDSDDRVPPTPDYPPSEEPDARGQPSTPGGSEPEPDTDPQPEEMEPDPTEPEDSGPSEPESPGTEPPSNTIPLEPPEPDGSPDIPFRPFPSGSAEFGPRW